MNKLVFSISWTVLAALGAFLMWQAPNSEQNAPFVSIILTIMPLVGFLFIWDSLRKLRRFRSVRREDEQGMTVYVWTELDGSEKRSAKDPRPAWDADDRNFAD